jgi:hypothetical protein
VSGLDAVAIERDERAQEPERAFVIRVRGHDQARADRRVEKPRGRVGAREQLIAAIAARRLEDRRRQRNLGVAVVRVEVLADAGQLEVMVALERQRGSDARDIRRRELAVARIGAQRRDEPLLLEVAELARAQVRELRVRRASTWPMLR